MPKFLTVLKQCYRGIIHSDRGTQYTSEACIKKTRELGLRHSLGRTGQHGALATIGHGQVVAIWLPAPKLGLADR
jgi:hypothetical protein